MILCVHKRVLLSLLACACVSIPAGVSSTTPSPDGRYWAPGFHRAGVSGGRSQINAMVELEGSMVFGGSFTTAGSARSLNVARWDGGSWHGMGDGLDGGFEENVLCFAVHEGLLIAGGGFTHSGDVEIHGVARWNGTRWESMDVGIEGYVVDLEVFRGELYAVWHAYGLDWGPSGVVKWSGTSWLTIATGFRESGICPMGEGRLAVFQDQLYAAGVLVRIDGRDQDVARWDGSRWWPESWPTCNICALETHGDKLFAASPCRPELMSWDGMTWEETGGTDKGWHADPTSLSSHDGKLVIGGSFTKGPRIASPSTPGTEDWWNEDWMDWSRGALLWDGHGVESRHLGPSQRGPWHVSVLCVGSFGGELLLGGIVDEFDGLPSHSLARWTSGGWALVGPGAGLDVKGDRYTPSAVEDFVEYDGELVAGGRFGLAGNASAMSIASWNGERWRALGNGIVGRVNALITHDGDLVAGGDFATAGGIAARNIAAWDGDRWRNLGAGLSSQVLSLAVHQGALVASDWSGVKMYDGAHWQFLGNQPMSQPTNLISHDGFLYTIANFNSRNKRGAVARWNGSTWELLGSIPTVQELHPFGTGLVALGQSGRDMWFWDGQDWSSWGAGSETFLNMQVSGGILYVSASTPGANDSVRLLYWNGAGWSQLGSGFDELPTTMIDYHDHLHLGGAFTQAGGRPSACIARWDGPPPLVVEPFVVAGEPSTTTWVAPPSRNRLVSVSATGTTLRIRYDIASGAAPTQLWMYDVRGRQIASLASGATTPGHHILDWNWNRNDPSLPRGTYFLQMRSGAAVLDVKKFTLLK